MPVYSGPTGWSRYARCSRALSVHQGRVAAALGVQRLRPAFNWARHVQQRHGQRGRPFHQHCRLLLVVASSWGLPDHQWEDDMTADRRKLLLNYVQQVEPSVMQKFEDGAAPQVVAAMRQTVSNILGTLPPQFFRVTISTAGENLAQLMYSVCMTGYMFRNAWYRLELKKSLGAGSSSLGAVGRMAELVGSQMGSVDDDYRPVPQYAPGSQKRGVQGEVVRWQVDAGPEVTPAVQYIEQLEREVASLREQISEQATALELLGGNEVMDYLKTLSPGQLQELTGRAGDDVLEAMNTFIQRLLANEEEDWRSGSNDCTAVEMAQLLYWLMIVGYQLRMLEVRLDFRSQFELSEQPRGPQPPSLPPGR